MIHLETNFLEILTCQAVRFCRRAVRLLPAPLAQMRTALIRDLSSMVLQRKRSQGRTGHMIKWIFTPKMYQFKVTHVTFCHTFFLAQYRERYRDNSNGRRLRCQHTKWC